MKVSWRLRGVKMTLLDQLVQTALSNCTLNSVNDGIWHFYSFLDLYHITFVIQFKVG